MHRRQFLLAAGALAAFGSTARALGVSGQEFVTKVASSNMFEIESSKLALERSGNQDVKSIAEMLGRDHSQALETLEATATAQKLEMPAKMSEKHAAKLEELKAAEGEAFDKSFLEIQLQGHRDSADLLTQYGEGGDNQALREFAQATLPVVKGHLEMIEKANGKA